MTRTFIAVRFKRLNRVGAGDSACQTGKDAERTRPKVRWTQEMKLTMIKSSGIITMHMITVSKEDYLKAILEAESEGEAVISATLAHWLSVTAPAVTMALRRLKRDGLVRVQADGRVQLTQAGREIALRTITRHHLIERMLSEVFGMEWYKVHDEAERLEHAVSPDFEAKLATKL